MSRILPALAFFLAAVLIAFGLGVAVVEYKLPPYRTISAGAKTIFYSLKALTAAPYQGQLINSDPGAAFDALPGARFELTPQARDFPGTILVNGGLNEYRDLCGGDGCVGVEYDRDGAVVHAYPFRPDEIFAADITDGGFYREAVPADPRLVFRPLGLQRYGNGDLLVTFQSTGDMFPFAAGAARIDRDGHPRWFRFDYSHHWSTLLPDGRALVPDLVLDEGSWGVPLGPEDRREWVACETGRPAIDGIQILTPDGAVARRIDVAAALRASPFAAMAAETTYGCDPLHLNFVDVLDETAPGGAFSPGFYVISLRNLSAIAVLDPETDTITAMVRGGFVQQHSVRHLEGSKVLLFDNWGGDGQVGRVSRLLEVDLATGAERRVFPQPGTPQADLDLFSNRGSHLDISPDRTRAMVSYSGEGRGYEVDIETGAVYLAFNSLHDVSHLPTATEAQKARATRALLYGMMYVEP